MIELNVTNLVGGNITITTGGSAPVGHADTWYKYAGDTEWRTVSIKGTIVLIDGMDDSGQIEDSWNIVALEIGTDVTNIGSSAFESCYDLTSVTIPNSVTGIGELAFKGCSGLTSVTFLGKTLAQVQEMNNYNSWGIDPSVINVA